MSDEPLDLQLSVATATKQALIAAAIRAFEDAGISGLCAEGRWEAAVGAMRSYDVRTVVSRDAVRTPPQSTT